MNHLQHQHIPEEALKAVQTLRTTAALQGWGGITDKEPWSLNGIGPTIPLNDRIRELEAHLKRMSEDRDNQAARADQLKRSYDQAREDHWQTIQDTQARIEQARLELCQIGLSPQHHPTLEDAITGAREIARAVRRDLADPPADVQEAVMAKLRETIAEGFRRNLDEQARNHNPETSDPFLKMAQLREATRCVCGARDEEARTAREAAADRDWHHSALKEP
jgi:hypothetical protein